ncbi:MAG: hypothetical protein V7K64_12895 [Nostoc sp.]|uniref:hypothetical protein n=1 Tax=Nostoc sp. TaxID=1180 RepID=UPI002FF51D67
MSLNIAYGESFAPSHSQFFISEFYKLLSPALVWCEGAFVENHPATIDVSVCVCMCDDRTFNQKNIQF